MDSDAELLHQFAQTRSEDAFAGLVRRHLPVVYGAALRRVGGDTHRAEDVAQEVFSQLARKAAGLRGHPVLAGWLYTTAQNVAMKMIRTEVRRSARETAAAGMSHEDIPWERLRPVIDEALLELPERERDAVLLRFFQDETFPAIGARLGLTDSGARMRTEQALESLRTALSRRGVTSTGAAIAGALAAHGSVVAPAGVATAIAANAVTASAGGLILLMSTSTLKTTAVALVVAAGAAGLFLQNRANESLRAQVASLQSELSRKGRQSLEDFRGEAATTKTEQAELARLRAEVARLSDAPPPNEAMAAWALRLANLKQHMAANPAQSIPELRLLSEEDWLDASRPKLETEEDYRKAMAKVRTTAERTLGQSHLQPAMKKFAQENGNQLPTDIAQLRPYLGDAVDAAMLQRWDIMPANAVPNLRLGEERMISQKAPVDAQYDQRLVYGTSGSGSTNWPTALDGPEAQATLQQMMSAFRAGNNGAIPENAMQLAPYATTPQQRAVVQQMLNTQGGGGGAGGSR